ncbi:MAG: TVP38/TMEM64 family protein [Planctomycetaceae bacterium]|nr:TVP38/TMEM64 family protein [Planctomycetaceae bacterium]
MNTESHDSSSPAADGTRSSSAGFWLRLSIAALVIVGLFFLSRIYGSSEILDFLAQQESRADQFRTDHPVAVYGVAFFIYVLVTGLSLPGAAVLTILFGWFFGFTAALILVSFASTSGATLAFLMSRYFLRDSIQRQFGERLKTFNKALEREGGSYLFALRLVPAVPFFVINLVMGLTPIRVRTYWWISQVGMLPGTAVYTYAGSSIPEITAIQSIVEQHGLSGLLTRSGSEINLMNLFLALILLGLFPLAVKWVMKFFRAPTA